MKRFIDIELKKWKSRKRRKPLIIRGARQVGKTYSVKRFGEKNFDAFVLADLERNPELHRVFIENLDVKRIRSDLELLLKTKIEPGKTLLFIDEIQECPQAISSLRYFNEEMPELHVIAAGSLLEFSIGDFSFPVGRVQFLNLYPLSFIEYLNAVGHEAPARLLLSPPKPVSAAVHDFLINELRRYFFIGGMPESVLAYAETGSFQESFEVQAEICSAFRLDFAKYKPQADKTCINSVWTSVAQKVGRQVKYAALDRNFSNPTIKKAFNLLCMAKLIKKIPSADPSGLPLGAATSDKIFKSILLDIGLMRFLTGMPTEIEYQNKDLLSIYQGAMSEQFAGQEMVVSQKDSLYYWSRQAKSSTAEVDFLSVIDGRILPIEIKSGQSGRLRSLHLFLDKYTKCPGGIVFSSRPYAQLPEKRLTFIPLYFVFSATGGADNL